MKEAWQKLRKNHLLMMLLCCLAPIVLIAIVLLLFKTGGSWVWLIALLCPLSHILMMGSHKHNGNDKEQHDHKEHNHCKK